MAVDNLKWEFPHTARAMPVIDLSETFGIGFDAGNRNLDGDAEIAGRSRTALRVPIGGCLQFARRFGMKTNSHRQHRAS
jgi:hypothetical protein